MKPSPAATGSDPDERAGPASLARRVLVIAGAGAACGSRAAASPDSAAWLEGPGGGPGLRAALERFAGAAVLQEGGVHLDIPELVENGNAVPVTVQVDSPMTDADHVVAIALFTGRNPLPEVAEFSLGPVNGTARVSTRIRLATSQKVVAAARMVDGRVRVRQVNVLVTLAACVEG